jgi:hypothetical protein
MSSGRAWAVACVLFLCLLAGVEGVVYTRSGTQDTFDTLDCDTFGGFQGARAVMNVDNTPGNIAG